jgi:LPS sulfotransferase NodH
MMRHLFLLAQPRSGTNYFYQLLSNADGPFRYATLAETIYNGNLYNSAIDMYNLQDLVGAHHEKYCVATFLQQNDGFDLEFFKWVVSQFHHDNAKNSPILVKWFPHGMQQFTEVLNKKGKRLSIPLLNSIFGEITWVDLYRENLIQQAVSYGIASQTKQWIKFKSNEAQPNCLDGLELLYDFDAILKSVHWLQKGRVFWPTWLESMGIQSSYTMTYEQLAQDYEQTLTTLSERTGLPFDIPSADQILIEPQRNETNDLFIARFKADCDSRGIDSSVWESAPERASSRIASRIASRIE